jgi:PAS domain S-box-containing protein
VLQEREAVEAQYLQTSRNELQMLAATIDPYNPNNDQIFQSILKLWTEAGHGNPAPDEHFVIVDNRDSTVILQRPSWLPIDKDVIVPVREKMRLRDRFSGTFQSESGTHLLGSFLATSGPREAPPKDNPARSGIVEVLAAIDRAFRPASKEIPVRSWMLGIFRSQQGLHESVGALTSFRNLMVVCGLAMPLSLLLMFGTYVLAQRGQVQAEQARSRLVDIVQSSEDAIFSETLDGVITSWNRGAQRLFGYSDAEAVGHRSSHLIPAERVAREREIIAEIGRGEFDGEHTLETIRICKDGRPVHVSQTVSPIEDVRGKQIGVSVIARDTTERRALEREVLESTGREQQRIGRELHDSLGQELTGLGYLAKSLSQKLNAMKSPYVETAQTITSGIQKAINEVRSAVRGLVPVEVDASGFMVALEKLAADTEARCGIECRIAGDAPITIDDNLLATHLYRIVQEAINNAVKHAHARHITVRPQSDNGTLQVAVQDDGVGIAGGASGNGGMGLRIMRYRAGVIDAVLDVQTTSGSGTAVVCRIKKRDHHSS